MNRETQEAIRTIIENGAHKDAIALLALDLHNREQEANHAASEARASLCLVKKLNRGKNKAIDAACEIEQKQ